LTEPDCDDACPNTADSYDAATCACVNVLTEPDCDDGDPDTVDSYNSATCSCVNEATCTDPCANNTGADSACTYDPDYDVCDDGCVDTADSYNYTTCECEYVLTEPDCNDNCADTADSYDAATCACVNVLTEPDCDDACPNTADSYDAATCACVNTLTEPDCDDACPDTVDSYDAATCSCVNELTEPDCDDGDPDTVDSYNSATCSCVNEATCTDPCANNTGADSACTYDPDYDVCDDGCADTADSYNYTTCECEFVLTEPDCDDACPDTADSYDAATCACVNELTEPDCDDGDSATVDSYDAANCTCVNESTIISGCMDPCSSNYNPDATQDDGSCNMMSIIDIDIELNIPSCSGGGNGSIVIEASGGTEPLSYSIDGGAIFQSSNTFTNITVGNYSIIVNDANGCAAGSNELMTEPDEITLNISTQGESCFGGDGQATATAGGGTGPYTYQWDDVNAQDTGTAGGLGAGVYNVTVTDANGCTTAGQTTLSQLSDVGIIDIVTTANTCGNADGTLTITGEGGNPPYMYSIDNGGIFQADNMFTELAEGAYNVVIQDADGCETTATASVIVDNVLDIPLVDTLYLLNGMTETITLPDNASYDWSPMTDLDCNEDCTVVEIESEEGTVYTITASTDDGCMATHILTVIPIDGVIVPDVLTPNGDGENDVLIMPGVDEFPQNEFSVYNRWGERVHHAQPYTNAEPWDGMKNGKLVPAASYYYILELNVTEIETLKGRIFIVD